MIALRVVKPEGAKKRPGERCRACNEFAFNGKPYCPDHIDQLGYPARLMQKVEAWTAQVEGPEHPACQHLLSLIGWEWTRIGVFKGSLGGLPLRPTIRTLILAGLVEGRGGILIEPAPHCGKRSYVRRAQ